MVLIHFFLTITINIIFVNIILMRFLLYNLIFFKKLNFNFIKQLSSNFDVTKIINFFLLNHLLFLFLFSGTPYNTNNFSLTNSYIGVIYVNIIVFFFYINFFKKKNFFFIITCYSYINIAFFLIFTNNFFLFFMFMELIAYSFLLVIVSLFFENLLFFKNKGFLNIMFIQLVLNFFSSILFYFVILYYSYSYGLTNHNYLNIFNKNPGWFNIIFCFVIFFKTSLGPWFFWNLNIYESVNINTLYIYISVFFLLLFFPILRFLVGISFIEKFTILITFLLLSVYINYNIYNISTIKTFLLFSSYSVYIIFIYLLCFF